jgi:8-oxo-dGTP pyrophosphatase MutT (NUDIX family)
MSEEEINLIFNDNFDNLWMDLWRTNYKKTIGSREYVYVKDKYNAVLNEYKREDFKPKYPLKEWGFPKGRKNNTTESALSCAVRECIEETGLYKNEMNVLMSVHPVVEDLIGTNGKLYRLIYFISVVKRIRKLIPIENEEYFSEIEDIGWFLRHKISNLFRPYHVKKMEVVDKIINFIAYTVYCIKYL